jgi:anthranilate phosphoribosyltransferase
LTPAARFAPFIATLGRGPGRSRALTREEACEAFGMVLRAEPDPHQIGAFLMLLRYRGEDADEITGLVEAARGGIHLGADVDLDWPSYGAGRTRGLPWFLLAALALSRAGIRVLMHGSNEFSSGVGVADGLAELGQSPAASLAEAEKMLARDRFAYLPLENFSPPMLRLLRLRELFGLRSPVNTVARLLDPGAARAGVDGVFHPAYIDVHLGVAERLGRPRLLVLKGGGGEAERNPAKALAAHLWDREQGRTELVLPAWNSPSGRPLREDDPSLLDALWRGDAALPAAEAIVRATIAMALIALGLARTPDGADAAAAAIWTNR